MKRKKVYTFKTFVARRDGENWRGCASAIVSRADNGLIVVIIHLVAVRVVIFLKLKQILMNQHNN